MTRFAFLPCLGLLAACVGGPTGQVVRPPEGTQVIELYSGGTFSGSYSTSIYANDVVASEQIDQKGKMQRKVVQGRPGVFEAALAVLRAEGPAAAKATVTPMTVWTMAATASRSSPRFPGSRMRLPPARRNPFWPCTVMCLPHLPHRNDLIR